MKKYASDVLFFSGAVIALYGIWQFSWALALVVGGGGMAWLGVKVAKIWG